MGKTTYIYYIINIMLVPPVNECVEHKLNFVNVELPCPAEPKEVVVIVLRMLSHVSFQQVSFEFLQCLVLLIVRVSHKPKQTIYIENQHSYI